MTKSWFHLWSQVDRSDQITDDTHISNREWFEKRTDGSQLIVDTPDLMIGFHPVLESRIWIEYRKEI